MFKATKPHNQGFLKVSDIHKIYFEESGNPKGKPIIHLHGGPGSKSKPNYRRYYNPKSYRIIQFDQRGCGKSTPLGETRENTTQDLVEDMEKFRNHLDIRKWHVSGGSWGSTLALAYAQVYPQHASALLLRGIFTFRKIEIDWSFNDKPSYFYPDIWEYYTSPIPKSERKDLFKAFYKRLYSKDKNIQTKALKAISYWDDFKMNLISDIGDPETIQVDQKLISSFKVYFHYTKNKGFLKEGQLIKNINKVRNIPAVILHGRYDMQCPPFTAWDLHKAWPEAKFEFVSATGHRSSEPRMTKKIIEYTEKFSQV